MAEDSLVCPDFSFAEFDGDVRERILIEVIRGIHDD